jgi:hypothetical protein
MSFSAPTSTGAHKVKTEFRGATASAASIPLTFTVGSPDAASLLLATLPIALVALPIAYSELKKVVR